MAKGKKGMISTNIPKNWEGGGPSLLIPRRRNGREKPGRGQNTRLKKNKRLSFFQQRKEGGRSSVKGEGEAVKLSSLRLKIAGGERRESGIPREGKKENAQRARGEPFNGNGSQKKKNAIFNKLR